MTPHRNSAPAAPPTASLTERYIHAVLRRLPPDQAADIERELRASIGDGIDGRVEAGGDRATAEREVLTELGDPDRLAAGYTNRVLHLIGPALFLDYVRLVKVLLVTVLPIVAAVSAVVRSVEGRGVVDVVTGTIDVTGTTAIHLVFWSTVLFAILERVPGARWPRTWTPHVLPAMPQQGPTLGDLAAETIGTGLFATAILLSPSFRFATRADGTPISVLDPWLWDTSAVYGFVAALGLGLALSYARHYVRWNVALVVAYHLVGLATAAAVVWVGASERLINPEFVAAMGWPDGVTRWTTIGVMIAGALGIATSVVQLTVSLARRPRRAVS